LLTLILTIIGTLVPTLLKNAGLIGANTQNLITGILTPVETLIAGLKAGTTKTQDYLASLAAISGVITVLKANTNLPAAALTQIADLDSDVQAALAAYAQAGGGFDPSLYAPIADV
jgi:hypothetical protein